MKIQKFILNDSEECYVTAYLHEEMEEMKNIGVTMEQCPAVLICPGGAYGFVSEREGEPVAVEYYTAGYHAFVLHYSINEKAKDFRPLLELAAAIAKIRQNAEEWRVAVDKIAVCGFSAGGHLAASLGTLYNDSKFMKVCPSLGNIRPDAMVLGYPVITADEFDHERSISNVSGAKKGTENYLYFGLDKHVDSDTPPAFLWHTVEDSSVPVENSLKFASALSAANVPFELHIFPKGVHGQSLCTKQLAAYNPYNGRWVEWSIRWLNELFGFER